MCNKLRIYGFNEESISWIRSYLTERSQYVKIGNDISHIRLVKIGAPQGSVLSPVLFIILIGDIDDWADHATIVGFADDNSATIVDLTLQDVLEKLEHEAKNILSFMASNSLVANEAKTTFMILSNTLKVGNTIIPELHEQKLLGVTFSSDRKWSKHVESIVEKLNHRLYILRNISHYEHHNLLQRA